MSEKYIPLYRKYRPKNLQEVVGQEHIKKSLTNAISLNKISHAYLFTGPRGTGKTSSARILAKSLNCAVGPTLTPCEECPSCLDIKNSNPIDVIEIDAASNRSVEDAQNILEKIQYVPVNGKYKIYIIDEVHMLSKHAFNALLKTLEEPPENVIFILATTEPQKVLETITSRCQRFDFRRISTDDIIKHLKYVSKEEGIKIDNDALFTIAKNAAGGMRDSLALLDQISVLDSAKTITTEDVNKLLGRLSFDMLHHLTQKIIDSLPQDAIELLETIYNAGNEPSQILLNLLGYLKNLLIVKNCSGEELLIDLTQLNNTQLVSIKAQSQKIETHQIVFLIEKTSYYIKELKTTTNQHLWLEVAIIDLANLTQNTSLLDLQERLTKLEGGGKYTPQPSPQPIASPAPPMPKPVVAKEETVNRKQETEEVKIEMQKVKSEPSLQETSEASATAIQEETNGKQKMANGEEQNKKSIQQESVHSSQFTVHPEDLMNLWKQFLQNISSPPTLALLSEHARPVEISEKQFVIGCEKEFSLKALTSDMKKKTINEAAQKLLGDKINVIIKLVSAEEEKKNLKAEKTNSIESKSTRGQEVVNSSTHQLIGQDSSTEQEPEDFSDDDDYVEHELAKKKETVIHSDQVSMVMNLFGGKYIDE